MPLPPHIEDDGAFADLVGDDEEGGGRDGVQLILATLLWLPEFAWSPNSTYFHFGFLQTSTKDIAGRSTCGNHTQTILYLWNVESDGVKMIFTLFSFWPPIFLGPPNTWRKQINTLIGWKFCFARFKVFPRAVCEYDGEIKVCTDWGFNGRCFQLRFIFMLSIQWLSATFRLSSYTAVKANITQSKPELKL